MKTNLIPSQTNTSNNNNDNSNNDSNKRFVPVLFFGGGELMLIFCRTEIIEATEANIESVANNSTVLLTSAVETRHPRTMDSELLSMVVVANPRDDIIYVEVPSTGTENWTMEGYYDVEESGTLVPFHSDNGGLLNEDFDDETQ